MPKLESADDSKMSLNIEVDNFSVQLFKDQYDNICKLAEVANDYRANNFKSEELPNRN